MSHPNLNFYISSLILLSNVILVQPQQLSLQNPLAALQQSVINFFHQNGIHSFLRIEESSCNVGSVLQHSQQQYTTWSNLNENSPTPHKFKSPSTRINKRELTGMKKFTGFFGVIISSSPSAAEYFRQYKDYYNSDKDYVVIVSTSETSVGSNLLDNFVWKSIKHKIGIVGTQRGVPIQAFTILSFIPASNNVFLQLDVETLTLNSPISSLVPNVLSNLQGGKFRVTVSTAVVPRIKIIKLPDGSHKMIRGMYKSFLGELMHYINATLVVRPSHQGVVGSLLPNGSFTGILKDITLNESDFSLISAQWYFKHEWMDFSSYIEFNSIAYLMRKPNKLLSWQSLFFPLKATLWTALTISLLLIVMGSKVLLTLEEKALSNVKDASSTTSFSFIALTFLGGLLEQSVIFRGNSASNVLLNFWIFSSLIISCVYRSNLLAFLALPVLEPLPTTFNELAHSDFHIGFASYGGSTYKAMLNSKTPGVAQAARRIEFLGSVDCLNRTLYARSACICYDVTEQYLSSILFSDRNGRVHFFRSTDEALSWPTGGILPFHSVILETVSRYTRLTLHSGLSQRWTELDSRAILFQRLAKQTKEEKEAATIRDDPPVAKLKLGHFLGTFYLLSLGTIVSCIAFFTELFKHRLVGLQTFNDIDGMLQKALAWHTLKIWKRHQKH